MELGCIEKSDAHTSDTLFYNVWGDVQIHAQGLQHVSAATLAGNTSIAVLGHLEPTASSYKGCRG